MVHKFDKIRRLNKDEGSTFSEDEWVIVQEKIDGANFRVWRDENNELRFGSRSVEFLPESDPNCGYGNFTRAVEYIKSLNTRMFLQGYIYYFEAMIKHTLPYDFDKHPAAILIDVYDIENDSYWNVLPSQDHVAGMLECQIAPVVFEGKYEDFNHLVPHSKFGDFKAEGFVIKPLEFSRDRFGNRHIAKVVTPQFKEENREVFGQANDFESGFAMKYANQRRIEKHIKQLEVAKNEEVKPQWVPILSYNITYDIVTEEFKKLLKKQNPNLLTIKKEVERQVKLYLSQRGVL